MFSRIAEAQGTRIGLTRIPDLETSREKGEEVYIEMADWRNC